MLLGLVYFSFFVLFFFFTLIILFVFSCDFSQFIFLFFHLLVLPFFLNSLFPSCLVLFVRSCFCPLNFFHLFSSLFILSFLHSFLFLPAHTDAHRSRSQCFIYWRNFHALSSLSSEDCECIIFPRAKLHYIRLCPRGVYLRLSAEADVCVIACGKWLFSFKWRG